MQFQALLRSFKVLHNTFITHQHLSYNIVQFSPILLKLGIFKLKSLTSNNSKNIKARKKMSTHDLFVITFSF